MTASPPLVHALRQPVRAVARAVGKAGAKPLLARPTEMAAAPCPVVPSRDLPATPLAPKIISPKPLGTAAPAPVRRGGPRGAVLVSTALHLGLLGGYAVFAAPARPLLVPDLETAEVALISEAQFLALTAPQPQIVMAAMPALAVPAPTPTSTPTPALAAMPPADAPQLLVAPASEPVSLSVPAALPIPALPAAEPPPPAPEPLAAAPAAPAPKPKPKPQKAKAAPAVKDSAKADATPAKAKPAQKPSAQAAAAPSAPSPSTAGISAGEAKALKADWGAKVRARINRKVALPADSTPGTVKVRLEIAASGKLLAVGIAQSSGQPALDAAALKAVKSAAPFARAPKGLGEPSYSFSLPITFKS